MLCFKLVPRAFPFQNLREKPWERARGWLSFLPYGLKMSKFRSYLPWLLHVDACDLVSSSLIRFLWWISVWQQFETKISQEMLKETVHSVLHAQLEVLKGRETGSSALSRIIVALGFDKFHGAKEQNYLVVLHVTKNPKRKFFFLTLSPFGRCLLRVVVCILRFTEMFQLVSSSLSNSCHTSRRKSWPPKYFWTSSTSTTVFQQRNFENEARQRTPSLFAAMWSSQLKRFGNLVLCFNITI